MSGPTHARVKELFLAALERPPAERGVFLAEAGAEDVELRRQVEALLAFHDSSSGPGAWAREPVAPRFQPGELFASRYRMVARLGSGGMGEVWHADDLMLDTPVAVKLIQSSDARARAALLNEARLARQITHAAVCRVFDCGEHEGDVFLSMELVRGEDLGALLRRADRLSLERAVEVGCQVCDGLAAAHTQGVLHRDLKPANILVDDGGRVRITDFGIAVALGAGAAGGPAGTPGYMAPEQAAGSASLDTTCDMWAFGAVMFELLSGTPAFPRSTEFARRGEQADPAVQWVRLPSGTPRPLRALLEHCLVADPTRRLADASQARRVLDSLRPEAGSDSRTPRSILVLPFTNLSPDPNHEYFSDGLTEDVIADLSKIEALRVISRTTAMRFKGVPVDLGAVSRQLDVRYVLEGSARKSGSNLRITTQLVDAWIDAPLWSEKYTGTLDQTFEIQERVSRAVAEALRLRLTADDDRRLARRPTASGFVYDLYLRARRDILSFDRARLDRARDDLQRALGIVGGDPLLYAGLGMACWQYVNAGFVADGAWLDAAEAWAAKAVTLDPEGPHGPSLLAHLAAARGDIGEWLRHAERALLADPTDPDCLVWLAMGWTWAGHPDRARPVFSRLEAIDPLFDYLHFGLAFLEQCEGRFEPALERIRRARALEPGMVAWPLTEIQLLLQTGRGSDAVRLASSVLPPAGHHPLADMTRALVAASQGDRAGARGLLTEDLTARLWTDLQYAYFTAQVYALLGEVDEALKWLEQSTRRGFVHFPYLSQRDPLLDGLRRDERFDRLMAHVRQRWSELAR